MTTPAPRPLERAEDLEQLVAEADIGGRTPTGIVARLLLAVAVAWSLFQLWYASPLPFVFGFGVLNDTEARAIHLGLALFLAFTAYPAFKSSPRDRVPAARLGAGARRRLRRLLPVPVLPRARAAPRAADRRSISSPAASASCCCSRRRAGRSACRWCCVACLFMAFTFAGPYMPDVVQHKGASLARFISHQWLVTEGVFGIALGVSTSFVFLFVLFGTLLEKAGAGNWMMQISIALLGHLRGGPAKVAVVSSALNGVVSGSSVSNVVSGGIFTIPLMKRTGLSGVKAGAIEASSSINGQIMPPVMGAAAFLMVEYVGIPYSEIVKHALPAGHRLLHLAALHRASRSGEDRLQADRARGRARCRRGCMRTGLGISGIDRGAVRALLRRAGRPGRCSARQRPGCSASPALALYVGLVGYAARYPDLELDDPNAPIIKLPRAWEVTRTGLDFLIPLVVLLWCLMVEQLSPGLSAFWGTVAILGIVATRQPLLALFRGEDVRGRGRQGRR